MDLIFKAANQKLVAFNEITADSDAAARTKLLLGVGRRPFTYIRNTSTNPLAVFTLHFCATPAASPVFVDGAGIVLRPGESIQFDGKGISCCTMAIYSKLQDGIDAHDAGSAYTHQLSVVAASDLPDY